ncbi:MAG TPA: autoinducer binding domain-containing protein [Albitalea sp.]|uniref:helix-turn-helix transcriptional regulator n=1 Tax=Piscinibacter sp. TaxID=1903157 RepID=UPI002ED53722
MLVDVFASVLEVRDSSALLTQAVACTQRMGFETVDVTAVVDDTAGHPKFFWVGNGPSAYRQTRTETTARRDPVAQHCRRSNLPIVWNQSTYVAAGQADKWEAQARFGYHAGVAYALHLPDRRHFYIGVDRDRSLPDNSAEIARLAADLQLLAVFMEAAAFHVLLPESRANDRPALTPRELESLRWTMEGKTAWELGAILGISEQTAARHIHHATQKLGCVNKLQAVLKALQLKLIH